MAKPKQKLLAQADELVTPPILPEDEAALLQTEPTVVTPDELMAQPEVPAPEEVAPNGIPTSLVDAAKSPQERLLEMINSPEYKARLQELSDRGKQAIEEQRQGINQNEQALRNIEAQGPQLNLSPLLALTDAWTGSKFGQTYQQPETPEQRQLKLMALKEHLQNQRKGLTDSEINFLKSQLSTQLDPMKLAKEQSQMAYYDRYAPGGPMQQLAEYRSAQQARDKILQRLSSNKDLGARLGAYQTLDNALSNMAAGKVRTPQQLEDFQAAIIQGLGMSRGQSGVNERAERTFKTLDLNASKMMQFLSSRPQDVMKNKELVGHLQDLARQEQVNVKRQYQQKLNALGSGYSRLLEKYPDIRADVNDALGAYAGQFESPALPDLTKLKKGQQVHVGPQPKPFAPVPKTKKTATSQPGLDSNLDSMSLEELQQWMQTHGQ